MPTKAQFKAMEKGAPTRGVYGKKFELGTTGYRVFVPAHLINPYMNDSLTIGDIKFRIDHKNTRLIGYIPTSWLIDISGDVEEEEDQGEFLAA